MALIYKNFLWMAEGKGRGVLTLARIVMDKSEMLK
jgi:hypothetical protein